MLFLSGGLYWFIFHGPEPLLKVSFRGSRGIMKCLGVIWASEADGLNQSLLLTFSPANIMKLSGFRFGLVV